MSQEAHFSEKTKLALAGRAGYRCSYPDCCISTIGPGISPNETESIGVAAHIYSAADDGPRGTGGLSARKRSDIENGIWLCATHARLIDAGRGDRYPPSQLRRYRYLHEARVAMEQGHRPFGWIKDLAIHRSGVFVEESVLPIEKLVFLGGDNGTGKTFIFKMLHTLSPNARHSLSAIASTDPTLDYSIRLWNPEPHELRVKRVGDRMDVRLDGEEVPFNPLSVDVYFQQKETNYEPLETYLRRRRREAKAEYGEYDDVQLLVDYFGMDEVLLLSLLPRVGTLVEHLLEDVRAIGVPGSRRILVKDKKWRPDAPIHKISGGMLQMLALDIILSRAHVLAEQMPVLLLLNLPHLSLDRRHMKTYGEYLLSEKSQFQTLIECPQPEWWIEADIPWQRYLIQGEKGNARLVDIG